MYVTVLKQLLIMMAIAVLAFAFSKRNKLGEVESSFLSRLLLYFVNPCLIFNSFNKEFDGQKLKELAFVILLSIILHFIMTLMVTIFIRSKNEKQLDGLEKVGIVMTNCGFIGIPLINGVFGQEGIFYLTGYLAVFNIWLWTYGEYQMSHSFKLTKVLTNPNIIALLCGLALYCLPATLPEVIAKPLTYISDMNTALSMVLLGMLFASFKKTGDAPYARRIAKVCLLRLVVCPVVCLLLVLAAWKTFACGAGLRMELFVAFICSLCPVGMSVSSFACLFNKDASYTSLMVLSTSALCIISVPTFVRLAELLMPL
ncbi:MAG: AEC family transporter [Treponema sp.]|nr:AEC family transporter [Treponema sp.]